MRQYHHRHYYSFLWFQLAQGVLIRPEVVEEPFRELVELQLAARAYRKPFQLLERIGR
jgi:hypothetical protein